jgi:hypothetical protein
MTTMAKALGALGAAHLVDGFGLGGAVVVLGPTGLLAEAAPAASQRLAAGADSSMRSDSSRECHAPRPSRRSSRAGCSRWTATSSSTR